MITDKEVPSFQWGNSEGYQTYRLEKALETARRTTARRNSELSEREIEVLKEISEGTVSADGVINF